MHPSKFSSPFLSPPAKPTYRGSSRRPQSQHHQQPLVLDPSQAAQSDGSKHAAESSALRTPLRSSLSRSDSHDSKSMHTPMVHKFMAAASRGMTTPSSAFNTPYNRPLVHTTPLWQDDDDHLPAGERARSSSLAGFLLKLGANIPEYKRRFFLVEPTTHLSYFVSPHDTEPRGRLNLEGSHLQELEELPDGRYRFMIVWSATGRRVTLEARSKEVGQEWMGILRRDRVSALKEEVIDVQAEVSKRDRTIQDLQRQIENFKLVERDRDEALEESRRWKDRFENLDESLRQLTRRIRQPIDEENQNEDRESSLDDAAEKSTKNEEERVEPDDSENDVGLNQTNQSTSLLDITTDEDQVSPDPLLVPGNHFSALSNACEQQRESMRLASIEAATAVEDLQESNRKIEAMKKRMEKAEKHICKLWEENCTIREALKQKKRERRVLIREVKALQQEATESTHEATVSSQDDDGFHVGEADQSFIASDDERLINELEEHVASSIRLHEKFLTVSGKPNSRQQQRPSAASTGYMTASRSTHHLRRPVIQQQSPVRSDDSPLQPKLLSLFDGGDETDDDDDDEKYGEDEYDTAGTGAEGGGTEEFPTSAQSISSVAVEADTAPDIPDSILTSSDEKSHYSWSTDGDLERKNPLVALDEDGESVNDDQKQPAEPIQTKVITENGHATSRLVCPLQDVTETPGSASNSGSMHVYHLTFYSKKIGIQFQKTPPPPARAKGLLTAALTSDMMSDHDDSNKAASELRGVASISSFAKPKDGGSPIDPIPRAQPKDIVLVCGFEGFDDSGNNERPKLGARLVAFDGISVEIGNWTFDSIRNAIRARGRPMTLSFRNDYLTTEQRQILTRAVQEVSNFSQSTPIGGVIRPPSTTPSLTSAISHETDHFINEGDADVASFPGEGNEELDISAAATSNSNCWNSQRRAFSATSSVASNQRSFSEAGSSSVLSSTFAPLVANLLKGVKERRNSATSAPEYLSRESTSVDGIPEHKVFHSSLL